MEGAGEADCEQFIVDEGTRGGKVQAKTAETVGVKGKQGPLLEEASK